MITFLNKRKDLEISFDDSQETKDKVFEICLKYFKKLNHFSGESIGQSDDGYIEGCNLLCELADEGFEFVEKDLDDLI